MVIKPIRSDEDHDRALREVQRLWGAKKGTPASDRLDVLITLVDAYERTRYPIDLPNPIDAIRFRLEQQGLAASALVGIIGSRSRVHEVLRGDRSLSLAMIRRLNEQLGIPAEILIRPVSKKKGKRAA